MAMHHADDLCMRVAATIPAEAIRLGSAAELTAPGTYEFPI